MNSGVHGAEREWCLHGFAELPSLPIPPPLQGGLGKTCSYLIEHQLLPQVSELLDAHSAGSIKLIEG